jgi:hypothetical protein
LTRGIFRSVIEVQAAIRRYVDEINQAPKPLVWAADPNKIIAAVRHGHEALDSVHYDPRAVWA